MLGAAIALQLLKMQRLQVVKDPFIGSRPDDLHPPPVSRYNRLGETSVVCRVRLQSVELWVFEANLHATAAFL
jgi:hypothetical protein